MSQMTGKNPPVNNIILESIQLMKKVDVDYVTVDIIDNNKTISTDTFKIDKKNINLLK